MKGIILAGGKGTRLFPMTKAVSKQLLPLYDKPMVYYPLSVLMLAGIRDIILISTPEDIPHYRKLLGDGKEIGLHISYVVQAEPKGLAEAFILAEDYIADDNVCLILGDNVFFGQALTELLSEAAQLTEGAVIFGYPVNNPKEFGVAEFDENGNVINIEEKPEHPKSKYAVPGLYFYDKHVAEYAKSIKPSARGELEISTLNQLYLEKNQLKLIKMGRGMAWLDTGTPKGMLTAATFVETIQSRQSNYIACLEEIAWRRGFITFEQVKKLGEELKMTHYGRYILSLCED